MADFFEDQNNMDEDDDIITLYNEERDCDEDFYHLATLDVDDKWFVVLKPVEKLPDIEEDEVLIYEVQEGDDGDIFVAEGGVLGANELTFRTDLGDIRVNGALAGSQSDYTFFINTGTGSSNIPSGGSGAIRLNATTDLGDIMLRFEK